MNKKNNSLNDTPESPERQFKALVKRSEKLYKKSKKIHEELDALSDRLRSLHKLSDSIINPQPEVMRKNKLAHHLGLRTWLELSKLPGKILVCPSIK